MLRYCVVNEISIFRRCQFLLRGINNIRDTYIAEADGHVDNENSKVKEDEHHAECKYDAVTHREVTLKQIRHELHVVFCCSQTLGVFNEDLKHIHLYDSITRC